uniref:Uncharacterized protein n=1 Tax=Anguilla anguilla TaxID=7936 RepID=A0A0E9TBW4_ANGAN
MYSLFPNKICSSARDKVFTLV